MTDRYQGRQIVYFFNLISRQKVGSSRDPVLRRPAEPVGLSDLRTSELQLLIAQMRATMEAAPGVGLAAPQVGVPIQLAVLHDGPQRWSQLQETAALAARQAAGVGSGAQRGPRAVQADQDQRRASL